jgi:anaerobic selenocysteine-containing dehydrogenase
MMGQILTDDSMAPPVKGLMAWCMNPAITLPDSGRVRDGLAREDLFTVAVEHFMTDTALYADIVLPSTTQLEHFDIVPPWGHHYIAVNHPAIEPVGEALSHGEIMRRLAPRLGLCHPAFAQSDEQIAASALPPYVSLETLKSKGWVKVPPSPGPARQLRFTGEPLRIPEAPASDELRLLTPKGHHFLNSSFANMPRQRKAQGRPTLQIHPSDAAARGLVEGDAAKVSNSRGWIEVTLNLSDAIVPGVVALEGKWWFSEFERPAVGNLLTPSSWSPGGQPAYNDTFVMIVQSAGQS